jgi:hypothetical protein
MGFHSNDARRAIITGSVTDPTTKLDASPLLVRTRGAEAGIRTKIVRDFDSSISLLILGQPRVEGTNRYRSISRVDIDADLALTHARLIGLDDARA